MQELSLIYFLYNAFWGLQTVLHELKLKTAHSKSKFAFLTLIVSYVNGTEEQKNMKRLVKVEA